MQKLEWSPEFEIGIPVIDGQHRRIVDYINQLVEAIQTSDQQVVSNVIHHLIDYTCSHFAFEEALLEEVSYALLIPHQKTHVSFTRRIHEMKDRFEAGQDVAQELALLLRGWLIDHIKCDDASYADLVKQQFLTRQRDRQQDWVQRTFSRFFS